MSMKKIGINDIIDDIVNQNIIEFNKKSKKQQESQKEQILDTIKLALAGRNDNDERQTILIEISKSVNSYSQSFFDSNGNIDISLLSEVAKSTVKNAEKAGIINPVGHTVEKSNKSKSNFTEVVLTTAVIDRMINNYENLSKKEINTLLDNYSKLTRSQQKEVNKKVNESVNEILNNDKVSEEDKKEINSKREKANSLDKALDILKKFEDGKVTDEDKKMYAKIADELNLPPIEDIEKDENKKLTKNIANNVAEIYKEIEEIKERINKGLATDKDWEKLSKFTKGANAIGDFNEEKINEENVSIQNKSENKNVNEYTNPKDITATMEDSASKFDFEVYSKEEKEERKDENNNLVKSQIEQLPNELAKAGFSENDIKEAMSTYTEFFKGLDNDDLEALSEETVEGLTETIKGVFEDFEVDENVGKILGLMAGITYHGNIKEVLIDSEKREQFFSELEEITTMDFESKAAEVATEGTEQQFTDEELKQVFNEYFKANSVEMNVSAIERQAEKTEVAELFEQSADGNEKLGLNQDVVANIFNEDMESVSDEDNATQGSTSSGAKKFSINDVKAVASGVKMPEIQDSTKLIHEVLNEKAEREEEQEVQTV